MTSDETNLDRADQDFNPAISSHPVETNSQKSESSADISTPIISYPEKTDRIRAWSDLIKSTSKIIWISVVVLIALQIWGSFAINNMRSNSRELEAKTVVTITIPPENKYQISTDVATALGKALVSARVSASNNLETWQNDVMSRVDHPFLDWYYNYFTQLSIGLEAIWANLTTATNEDKAEKLIGSFQKEFAKQVLQPPLMQIEMERFTREAVNAYVSEANRRLNGIQSSYEIPQPAWDNFLEGLGGITYNTGGQEQDLPLRALTRGTGYVATATMMKAVTTIGTKKVVTATASKAASKAASKVAAKTAGKALAEGGGLTAGIVGLELINPIAGLGILAWDIWDHYHTVKVERPIMHENLENYVSEIKDSLLNDTDSGILASINAFHDGIMDNLVSSEH
jgi:hypothetical protein